MESSDPSMMQRETSVTSYSANSTNQHLAYASQRAEVLFGCYRRGDANSPERYVAAISAVLSLYDEDLIREVTDPRTGISTSEKHMSFLPNSGELKVYCDGIAARRERIRQLGALPVDFSRGRLPPRPSRPGNQATVFVSEANSRYQDLVEWSKSADPRLWKFGKSSDGRSGIWVALHVLADRLVSAGQEKV